MPENVRTAALQRTSDMFLLTPMNQDRQCDRNGVGSKAEQRSFCSPLPTFRPYLTSCYIGVQHALSS